MMSLLMKHPDVDPNGRNEMFDAPIHAIVKKKAHSEAERADKMATLFNLLVYSNADVNAAAAYGMTALHMAANVIHFYHLELAWAGIDGWVIPQPVEPSGFNG